MIRKAQRYQHVLNSMERIKEIMIRKSQRYQNVLDSMKRISNMTSLKDIPDEGYTNKNKFVRFLGTHAIMAGAEEVALQELANKWFWLIVITLP